MKKKTPHSVDWEAISKYFNGEMDKAECQAFEERLEQDSSYAQIVANSQKDWQTIEEVHKVEEQVDTEAAWKGLLGRFESENLVPKPAKAIRFAFAKQLLQVAASVLLVLGLSFGGYKIYQQMDPMVHLQTAYTEGGKNITLPDGSKVFLNGNSQFSYPKSFGDKERNVQLKGEAFLKLHGILKNLSSFMLKRLKLRFWAPPST